MTTYPILHTDIIVSGIRLHAYHGVMPQERLTGNDYEVSVVATCQVQQAIHTDQVAHTLNYAEVYDTVKEEMSVPSCLVEHVAGRIARHLLDRHPCIQQVRVKLLKLNPPMGAHCDGAGIDLTMARDNVSQA